MIGKDKTKVLVIVSKAEHARFKVAAKSECRSFSSWARLAMLDRLGDVYFEHGREKIKNRFDK